MPVWAKALIAILVLGLLLLVGLVGAGVYLWSRNKDGIIAKGQAQIEEGRDAGRATRVALTKRSCAIKAIRVSRAE
jgi:hypothetical protein